MQSVIQKNSLSTTACNMQLPPEVHSCVAALHVRKMPHLIASCFEQFWCVTFGVCDIVNCHQRSARDPAPGKVGLSQARSTTCLEQFWHKTSKSWYNALESVNVPVVCWKASTHNAIVLYRAGDWREITKWWISWKSLKGGIDGRPVKALHNGRCYGTCMTWLRVQV